MKLHVESPTLFNADENWKIGVSAYRAYTATMTRFNLPLSRKLALAIDSNHRMDTACNGRYIRRLPDHTLVYADQYEERLRQYELSRETAEKQTEE